MLLLLLKLALFLGFKLLLLRSAIKVDASTSNSSFLVDEPAAKYSIFRSGVDYHGGRLLVDPITVYLIWLGHWPEHSKQALRTAVISISVDTRDAFPDLFKWWKVATQYKDTAGRSVSNSVSLGSVECSATPSANLTREEIGLFLLQAFGVSSSQSREALWCNSVLPQDENAVYHLLFDDKVSFSGDSDSNNSFDDLCSGRFRSFSVDDRGPELSMAWSRAPRSLEYCNFWGSFGEYLAPPNAADEGQLDSLISSVLARTVDMATNNDFEGWRNKDLSSVTAICPSPTGFPTSDKPVLDDGKTSWNLIGVNGSRYIVQQIWSNKTGLCALQPREHCKGLELTNRSHGIISQGLIINHSIGLQPYGHKLHCSWKASIPGAVLVRFRVNYLSIVKGVDYIYLYTCDVIGIGMGPCLQKVYTGLGSPHQVELYHSMFLLVFDSGREVALTDMGWEFEYRAGYCHGTKRLTDSSGILTDGTPENATYLEQHTCGWILQGAIVELEFVRFDTVKDQDEVVIYKNAKPEIANILRIYSGSYSSMPREIFPGPVLIEFRTKTGLGRGWAAKFKIKTAIVKRASASSQIDLPLIVAAVCGAVAGMLAAGLIVISYMRRVFLSESDREMNRPLLLPKEFAVFSAAALRESTKNFSSSSLIATGSRAQVYRATLCDGLQVAVKRSKAAEEELAVFSGIDHCNIVAVVGCCFDFDSNEKILVFELVPNGSLADHLFSARTLDWKLRLKIAVQISSALEYLHAFVDPSVIHGNVGSGNVLLDGSWNAKLAGFGSSSRSSVERVGAGNFGAKAEEVYRFGELVLELVTGERTSSGTRSICDVIEAGQGDRLGLIADKRIGEVGDDDDVGAAVMKLAEVGAWCMNEEARERPAMVEVASALRQVLAISMRSKR